MKAFSLNGAQQITTRDGQFLTASSVGDILQAADSYPRSTSSSWNFVPNDGGTIINMIIHQNPISMGVASIEAGAPVTAGVSGSNVVFNGKWDFYNTSAYAGFFFHGAGEPLALTLNRSTGQFSLQKQSQNLTEYINDQTLNVTKLINF